MRFEISRPGSLESVSVGAKFSVPGYYKCKVTDVGEVVENPTKCRVEYTVTEGEHTGQVLSQVLDNPADSSNADMAERKLKIVTGRLGVWDGETIPFEPDMDELIDKECVIHWEEQRYNDKRTGEPRVTCNVAFAGVYSIEGHSDIPPEVATELGIPVVEKEKKGGKGKPAAPAATQPKKPAGTPNGKPAARPATAAPAKARHNLDGF